MKPFFKSIYQRAHAHRRFIAATGVAAMVGLAVGISAYLYFPGVAGLRARDFMPPWLAPARSPLDGKDNLQVQNRFRDRQARKLAWRGTGADEEGARQLAQAVMATVRNFYVDAERVTERQLGEIIAKVIRKKSSAIELVMTENSISMASSQKNASFSLTSSGLVELVTNASLILSNETEGSSIQRCRELLNLLVAELDPHSSVLSPAAYNELRQGTEGSFGGLGVIVGIRGRVLTVIKPLPNSPAIRSGILAGDRIVRINNQPTFGMALEDLMEFMRGSPGTHVTMRILREGAQAPMDIVLKREVIQVDSVTVRPVSAGPLKILHVVIETFSARTSREILSAMKSFKKNHGAIDGMIMDLRSNPGGLLDQAVQVTDLFLEDGIIVSTRGRREEVEVAGKGYDEVEFPMVVLINDESASASEIVAGALQDHGRAIVVGQPSFGKGSVQTVFELPFEAALKLTIARYFTPANRSIQNVGILPDIWLQPMISKTENMNLLGPSRYRNEGFLLHSLDGKSQARQHLVSLDQRMAEACCSKAYVLTVPPTQSGDEGDDDDMDAAKAIIAAAHEANSDQPLNQAWNPGKARSLIGNEAFRGKIDELAGEANAWVKSRFGIVWNLANEKGQFLALATDTTSSSGSVDFAVQTMGGDAAASGEQARFLWTATNKGSLPLHRISVYLRSSGSSGMTGDTHEVLVGSIRPGESRSGAINAVTPFLQPDEAWEVDVGLAVDAWPIHPLTRHFYVDVKKRGVTSVSLASTITAEKGGVANGVLDPGEQASLRLVVTNDGQTGLAGLSVHLVNLSGARVSIGEGEVIKQDLMAGATATVDVPVVFHGNQASEEVDIGISVESKEMENPVSRQITLPVSVIAGRIGGAISDLQK